MSEYFWISYLVSAIFIPIIITKKTKPISAIAWILTILFLPILGVLLFLVFGTDRIVNKGRKKLFSNEVLRDHLRQLEEDWSPVHQEGSKKALPKQLSDIVRIARQLSLFDAIGHNKVELLVDGEETYQNMEDAILAAEDHINLEYYIFRADEVGARFRDLLVKKAKQGVKVNFLYDAIGSMDLGWNREFLNSLREAGVKTVDFLPLRTFIRPWNLNLRNHRKILVVDNKIGFTGSLNVGDEFVSKHHPKGKIWRETHVKIQGPAVTQLQWVFCEDWYFTTGEELFASQYFKQVETEGEDVVQIVASGPDAREEAIHKVFVTSISQAKKSVFLTSPYLIPDQALNLTLQIAALRGVDVRILVPSKSDHTFVKLAGRSYYLDLLKNGVKIFEYASGYLHAKMLVVDGCFTVIGSANVDVRSFSYNFEVNVQIYGETFAKKAEKIFFKDLENSRELDAETYSKRPAHIRFSENFCRLFSPLL